jgi:hypothetical protein
MSFLTMWDLPPVRKQVRKQARHPSPPVLQSSLPVELQWQHTVLNEPKK